MHELSLAEHIVELVQAAAQREGFSAVRVLRLQAGALSGVEVQALRFALDAVAPRTCLQGARIEIDEPPGQAWCPACAQTVTIDSRIDPCPQCGGFGLRVTGGTELRVAELIVADAPGSAVPDASPTSTSMSSGSASVSTDASSARGPD